MESLYDIANTISRAEDLTQKAAERLAESYWELSNEASDLAYELFRFSEKIKDYEAELKYEEEKENKKEIDISKVLEENIDDSAEMILETSKEPCAFCVYVKGGQNCLTSPCSDGIKRFLRKKIGEERNDD